MATSIKISQLPAKGSNLEATDLLEVSEFNGTGYVSKSITGQEIIDSIPIPSSGITIGTTAITSGTVGRVLFQGSGNVVQESGNLFWDNTNSILQITKALGATMRLNCTSSNPSKFQFTQELSVGVPTEIGFISNQFGTGMILQSFNSLYFNANNAEKMRIVSGTGNVLINTTTDAGFRLDVQGTVRIADNLNFNNVSSVQALGTTATDARMIIRGGQGGAVGSIPLISLTTNNNITSTSGNPILVNIARDFAPTSGTATYTLASINPTINQTGGANGITRGLYINPTLTSASDFRAIEVSSGGAYINTTSVQASAILQADSTTKGFLPPRMTTTQKNAIASPATGLVVFDTTLNILSSFNGTSWTDVSIVSPPQIVTSSATVTPTSSNELVAITAQAVALTLAAPTGTPVQGQPLMIRIKDNGTARAITWTSGTGGYRAIGVTLPTTTVANKTTYVGCIYNSTDSRWDVMGVTTEA